ncbi:excreted virulence factor EspC (type VII ESX diderm) [Prauserella shujinwangii]|uniref:Excreted virulence factor EspC (Type VII ESX diderm) n=1 Tax=Prauserella shujinwangii TaxID=1453103 RepID=A0A2T0M3K4_9PSEU|nr:type VII secretion target [Prauserella shujinwangii]PRX51310.1 excreted virulence factor EspC (type VII ESX diderm) [Prauserella shujinwangii]
MSGGFHVEPDRLVEFGRHLGTLESALRDSAATVGGCVADVGIFGLIGQLFGAGASKFCAGAERQLGEYATVIAGFADDLATAAKEYEATEEDTRTSIAEYEV